MKFKLTVKILLILIVLLGCNFPIPVIKSTATVEFNPSSTPPRIITTTPNTNISAESYLDMIRKPLISRNDYFEYYSQSGDTLDVVARRFNVPPESINADIPLQTQSLIPVGSQLQIPDMFKMEFNDTLLFPDSEVIFSPNAENFDVYEYIEQSGGFLNTFTQIVGEETLSGAEIVDKVAKNTSVNPRLLLAIIEFRSAWLTTVPENPNTLSPLGFNYKEFQGFYLECSLAARWINTGYYGWRHGDFTDLNFIYGNSVRLSPHLNPGTVAIQYFLAQLYTQANWEQMVYGDNSFLSLYQSLFGDAWERAKLIEPLFPDYLEPPQLELPFHRGEQWALTAGLHVDWNTGTPKGALDFAPLIGGKPCSISPAWVTAPARGIVTRSDDNIVELTLTDVNGNATGWVLIFMHISTQDQIQTGTLLEEEGLIGHPSCEGGIATGTHVHVARKFKGEWIGASAPFTFILSGWTAYPGDANYSGTLEKAGLIISSRQDGSAVSWIKHE